MQLRVVAGSLFGAVWSTQGSAIRPVSHVHRGAARRKALRGDIASAGREADLSNVDGRVKALVPQACGGLLCCGRAGYSGTPLAFI